jgi:hypothetical protein
VFFYFAGFTLVFMTDTSGTDVGIRSDRQGAECSGLRQTGLELIRNPVDLENSSQIDDQITRELPGALEQPAGLKLVTRPQHWSAAGVSQSDEWLAVRAVTGSLFFIPELRRLTAVIATNSSIKPARWSAHSVMYTARTGRTKAGFSLGARTCGIQRPGAAGPHGPGNMTDPNAVKELPAATEAIKKRAMLRRATENSWKGRTRVVVNVDVALFLPENRRHSQALNCPSWVDFRAFGENQP